MPKPPILRHSLPAQPAPNQTIMTERVLTIERKTITLQWCENARGRFLPHPGGEGSETQYGGHPRPGSGGVSGNIGGCNSAARGGRRGGNEDGISMIFIEQHNLACRVVAELSLRSHPVEGSTPVETRQAFAVINALDCVGALRDGSRRIVVGDISITKMEKPMKWWLEIRRGEGMEIGQERLENIFMEIFNREF